MLKKILLGCAIAMSTVAAQANGMSEEDLKANCEGRAMWAVLNGAIRSGLNRPALNENRVSIQHIMSTVDKDGSTVYVTVTAAENMDYILVPRMHYFTCVDGQLVQ